MELGAFTEFGGLQKKVEREGWWTSTTLWVDMPAQKEEGLQKSDGHGMVARQRGRGGGRDEIFNHGVDPQLRIMDRLGDMTASARLENLRIPLAADGRDICLHFLSKGYCIRSFTRSHEPVRGHNREALICYIRVGRGFMELSRKRKSNDGGDRGSHGGH